MIVSPDMPFLRNFCSDCRLYFYKILHLFLSPLATELSKSKTSLIVSQNWRNSFLLVMFHVYIRADISNIQSSYYITYHKHVHLLQWIVKKIARTYFKFNHFIIIHHTSVFVLLYILTTLSHIQFSVQLNPKLNSLNMLKLPTLKRI